MQVFVKCDIGPGRQAAMPAARPADRHVILEDIMQSDLRAALSSGRLIILYSFQIKQTV